VIDGKTFHRNLELVVDELYEPLVTPEQYELLALDLTPTPGRPPFRTGR
jgi:hypothetical protein